MSGFIIVRTDFSVMENSLGNAVSRKNVAMFSNDEKGTAFAQAEDWLKAQEPPTLYLGWNRRVYPHFTIEEIIHE